MFIASPFMEKDLELWLLNLDLDRSLSHMRCLLEKQILIPFWISGPVNSLSSAFSYPSG